jgi:predicted dehydrogenase
MPRSLSRRIFLQGGLAAGVLSAASYRRVLGANERIGVGFIGYGLIGKRHLLDFQAEADADLRCVAEVHRGRLDEAIGQIGSVAKAGAAKGHRDFRRLLDDNSIQAVVVSTPDHWHALMSMLACAAGKDVYVEKPLTLFVREGRWMLNVAQRTKRVVQVGTQQRSGPHYARVKEMITSGRLGKVVSVRMSATRNIMPGYGRPSEGPPPAELDWDLWQGPAPARPFHANRAIYHFRWFWDYSGGQMTNLAAHSIDILDWCLAPSGPASVMSTGGRFALEDNGETPDTQDALFAYPGFSAAWTHREASAGATGERWPLEFYGTRGSLKVSRSGFVLTPDRKIAPGNTVPSFGEAPVGAPERVAEAEAPQWWTEAAEDKTGDQKQQFRGHVRNFLDCIKSRSQPVSDLASAHRTAIACHLANISLRLGRAVKWNAEREEIVGDAEAAAMLERPYRAPWDAELKALNVT